MEKKREGASNTEIFITWSIGIAQIVATMITAYVSFNKWNLAVGWISLVFLGANLLVYLFLEKLSEKLQIINKIILFISSFIIIVLILTSLSVTNTNVEIIQTSIPSLEGVFIENKTLQASIDSKQTSDIGTNNDLINQNEIDINNLYQGGTAQQTIIDSILTSTPPAPTPTPTPKPYYQIRFLNDEDPPWELEPDSEYVTRDLDLINKRFLVTIICKKSFCQDLLRIKRQNKENFSLEIKFAFLKNEFINYKNIIYKKTETTNLGRLEVIFESANGEYYEFKIKQDGSVIGEKKKKDKKETPFIEYHADDFDNADTGKNTIIFNFTDNIQIFSGSDKSEKKKRDINDPFQVTIRPVTGENRKLKIAIDEITINRPLNK